MNSAVADEQITTWARYVYELAGADARQAAISARTGIDQGTISRWLSHSTAPSVRAAVAFARGYGVSPVEALIAAGYLAPGDAELPTARARLTAIEAAARALPTDVLLAEISRRTAS